MRRATADDRPAIEAFLRRHLETSMFPLSNLLRNGMGGGHPRAMRFWVAGEPVGAVLGLSEEGFVLPQLPPAAIPEAARALAGERIAGIIGEAGQAAALRAALGLRDSPAEAGRDEDLFTLDLADLVMPEVRGLALAPFAEAPRDLLVAWRAAYGRETLGWGEGAEARAERDVNDHVGGGQHRVLLRDGVPVAQAGLNARLPECVQVGAVWTPPPLRGRGLARAAVALLLAEARAGGASRAVLFTANPAAARAYRALGFREAGRFALLIFAEPQEARPA